MEAGYATCSVDSLYRRQPWFGRGYEYLIDPSVRRTSHWGVTCEEANQRAIPWMQKHAHETFFLFIHYWDLQWALTPPARYRDRFYEGRDPTASDNRALDKWLRTPLGAFARDTWLQTENGLITDPGYIVARYDQKIRHLDDGVGQILDALDNLGLTERTLVLISSDHGESFTEHGIFFDHHGLYDCTLRVPLIASWRGHLTRGLRLSQIYEVTDIAPTLLDAGGLVTPRAMDGRSFWRALTGQEQEKGREHVISAECTRQAKWSLRTEGYRYILAREPGLYAPPPRELYDLQADAKEERNIVEERPEVASAMEANLEDWIAARLQALGKAQDPLLEQGPSLGWRPTR
jgi:arylsulfatase A-like enzyme